MSAPTRSDAGYVPRVGASAVGEPERIHTPSLNYIATKRPSILRAPGICRLASNSGALSENADSVSVLRTHLNVEPIVIRSLANRKPRNDC